MVAFGLYGDRFCAVLFYLTLRVGEEIQSSEFKSQNGGCNVW